MTDAPIVRQRRERARWIAAALLLVALFFGATVVTQRQARIIDQLALSLETHALPSIDALTTARGALNQLTLVVRDDVRAATQGSARSPTSVAGAQRALDDAMANYLATQAYPSEVDARTDLIVTIDDFKRAGRRVVESVDRADPATAQRLVARTFSPSREEADQALEEMIHLNTAEANRTGQEIQRARAQSTKLSYLLHALAGTVAALMVWALVRELREHAALVETRARFESERKRAAERRAAELDLFAARVEHDLKNPINTVALGVSLARERAADPAALRALESANNAVGRTRQIIDGLLDFARAAGERASSESSDVRRVVDAVVVEAAPHAERAGAHVVVEPFGGLRVACAEEPLHSVLANLVGNALKFIVDTPPERRQVRIHARDHGDRVRVEVQDTGPGISPELRERLFQPFVRAREAHQPGHGIGLATVRQIVEACGGAVGVRSTPGDGSTFWFEIPRASSI